MTNSTTSEISDAEINRMAKPQLIALHHRMMRERGSYTMSGGPRTWSDYYDAIICMRRTDDVRAAHFAEAGEGHERCGTMNFKPICGWTPVAAEVTA